MNTKSVRDIKAAIHELILRSLFLQSTRMYLLHTVYLDTESKAIIWQRMSPGLY